MKITLLDHSGGWTWRHEQLSIMNPWGGKKPQGEGKGNLTVFRTIKRIVWWAGKHLFPNSFWHMLWGRFYLYQNFQIYIEAWRDFSRWKLRISRLYLLEAPEGRCWDQVRRRRGLQGDLASQGSRVGGGRLGGVKPSDVVQVDHHPVPPVSPHPGEGPAGWAEGQQLGSRPLLEFLQMNSQFCFEGRPEWCPHFVTACLRTCDFLGSRDY